MNRMIYFLTTIFIIGILISQATGQDVPPLINYQGMLTESDGTPLTGTHKLEFNIYNNHTDGDLIWGPQIFDNVTLFEGKFNVILGTTDNSGRSVLSAFTGSDRYLGIKVNSEVEIKPRQRILSAPYSITTRNANGYLFVNPYDGEDTEGGQIRLIGASSNPTWNLDAYGSFFRIFDDNVGVLLQMNKDGVSIGGDQAPTEKLDVNGNARIRNGLIVDGDITTKGEQVLTPTSLSSTLSFSSCTWRRAEECEAGEVVRGFRLTQSGENCNGNPFGHTCDSDNGDRPGKYGVVLYSNIFEIKCCKQ